MLRNPRLNVLPLVKHRAVELVESRTHVCSLPLAERRRADAEHIHCLGRAQEILLMKPFLFHSLPPTSNLERKQKTPVETKTNGRHKSLVYLGFHRSFARRCFTYDARGHRLALGLHLRDVQRADLHAVRSLDVITNIRIRRLVLLLGQPHVLRTDGNQYERLRCRFPR